MQIQFTDRQRSSIGRLRVLTSAVAVLASFASASALAADAGFTVNTSYTASAGITDDADSNAAASTSTYSYNIVGANYTLTTPAQPGVAGLFQILQPTNTYTYQTISDSYSQTVNGLPAIDSSTKYVDYSGLLTIDPASVFAGSSIYMSVSVSGSYTPSILTGIPGLPSADTGPAMPALYLSLNGGSFQAMSTGLSFSNGNYSAGSNTYLSAGSFRIIAATTGNMSLSSFQFGISGSRDTPTILSGTSNQLLYSQVIPALPITAVPEPREWAMLLSGLMLMGVVAKRRLS